MKSTRVGLILLLTGLAVVFGGCAQETLPGATGTALEPTGADGGPAADSTVPSSPDASGGPDASVPGARLPSLCYQARAEPLPARLRVFSSSGDGGAPVPQGRTVLIEDLTTQFVNNCAPCHTNGSQSPSIATSADFRTKVSSAVIARVTLDADAPPLYAMPPLNSYTGKPWSKRGAGDPIVEFVKETQAWIAAGSPPSFQYVADGPDAGAAGTGTDDGGAADYHLSPATANAMTNLGSCVPSPGLVTSATASEEARALQLDQLFAAAHKTPSGPDVPVDQQLGLPLTLDQTDLFTLDTRELAKYGVIAFAPGYPLWSDNAGKIRYVRVPRGQSIRFDKATQKFVIPPNTRFYKTFLKPIVERADGSIRWKKMETRLIVARPNPTDGTDTDQPSYVPPALFGTYKWDDDETSAALLQERLRNGEFFTDKLVEYDLDEPLAADLLQTQPQDPLSYLVRTKAARHYAIPSAKRCVECHRGSPSGDFVLGFNPLQIRRRHTGEGGAIEPTLEHELTQLQRLIEYGVVTGIDSIDADVLPLEKSEGSRAPRNDHELVAQGYMVGNCAHCHNPHGEPTVENPILRDALNFLPSADGGGIFQFPLERYSQRISRGNTEIKRIPYITPSLLDEPERNPPVLSSRAKNIDPFVQLGTFRPEEHRVATAIYAPWRSLLYRNVDDAFAYTDDVALFPHMPRNTPGYDPRAKQIMSDWMVSIPAVRKHPEIGEYEVAMVNTSVAVWADNEEQPYVEVLPGAPGYTEAVLAASQRLEILHTGLNSWLPLQTGNPAYSRYADPGDAFDIVDDNVVRDPICTPTPPPPHDRIDPYPFSLRPHWVVTDLTEYPGDWVPRRSDWAARFGLDKGAAADGGADAGEGIRICPGGDATSKAAAIKDEQAVLCLFGNKSECPDGSLAANPVLTTTYPPPTLDLPDGSPPGAESVRTFATTKRPLGLWKRRPGCTYPGQKRLGDFAPCDPKGGVCDHNWMIAKARTPGSADGELYPSNTTAFRGLAPDVLDPSAPVYMEAPGASVFKMICINCHGPLADSNGRMALNLATMTGGQSRVANFRHGLQGPEPDKDHPYQANFNRVFAPQPAWPADWGGLKAEGVAARYMAWMALGGTKAVIPADILTLVGTTTVVGERRFEPLSGSANMLSNAKSLCQGIVGSTLKGKIAGFFAGSGYLDFYNGFLIRTNGDAELWMRLCTLNNHPWVHAIVNGRVPTFSDDKPDSPWTLIRWEDYAASGVPVGNEQGGIDDTLLDSNEWPWCFARDGAGGVAGQPACPPGSATEGFDRDPKFVHPNASDIDSWAIRGAINAAYAVFVYLEWLETQKAPDPDYDRCDLLEASGDAGAP